METLHRLGYSGPGSQPLANVTVRRVSAATSLGGQDRMANILFNIRRMKQEIGRAPDQRPVPVEILLHDQVMSCWRSEEHTSELQSLMRISYAVFCLKKTK